MRYPRRARMPKRNASMISIELSIPKNKYNTLKKDANRARGVNMIPVTFLDQILQGGKDALLCLNGKPHL